MSLLSFVETGRILLSVFAPSTFVTFTPTTEKAAKGSSFAGIGADVNYGFTEQFSLKGQYFLNFNGDGSVFLSGWDFGTKFYVVGGVAEKKDGGAFSAFLAPRTSYFLDVSYGSHSFDIRNNAAKSSGFISSTKRDFDLNGSYNLFSGGAGAETTLYSPKLRLYLSGHYGRSFSVSTALKVSEIFIRLGMGYQL